MQCTEFSVIELVGNGNGVVDPRDLSVSDIAVSLSRPIVSVSDGGEQPTERIWLAERRFDQCVSIGPPDNAVAYKYDAVIVLSQVPIPQEFHDTDPSDLEVDVRISPAVVDRGEECPRCDSELTYTVLNGVCTMCGFRVDENTSGSTQ